jgi:membrane AbrB-like protein
VSFFLWFLLSCLLGIGFGMLLRLPAKYFLGPLLVSALIHVAGWSDYKLPFEMVIVAQIVLGATIGCRFVGVSAREIINVGVVSLGSTLILIVLTAVFAAVLSMYMDYGFLTLFLSYSPGGLAEISLLALAMQIETSIVVSHHLFRIVIVGFGGPLIFLLIKKLRAL